MKTETQHHSKAAGADDRPETADTLISAFEPSLRDAFPSREALLAEARAQTARQRSARRRVAKRTTTAASSAALGLTLLALLAWIDPAWQHETLQTAIAERRTHTLADGSTVMLAPGTVLQTEAHIFSRQFRLTQGEAMFTVSHNPWHAWRPFIVHADGTRVLDIGTRFNVRLRDQATQVTVTEGVVQITSPRQGALPQRVLAGQGWTLDQRSPPGTQPRIAAADLAQTTAWQRGKLVFDGTPLAQVLAEVQRYRRAPVRVDERAARLRVSGEYDVAGVESLIDSLPDTLPVRVQRAPDGSVVVRSR